VKVLNLSQDVPSVPSPMMADASSNLTILRNLFSEQVILNQLSFALSMTGTFVKESAVRLLFVSLAQSVGTLLWDGIKTWWMGSKSTYLHNETEWHVKQGIRVINIYVLGIGAAGALWRLNLPSEAELTSQYMNSLLAVVDGGFNVLVLVPTVFSLLGCGSPVPDCGLPVPDCGKQVQNYFMGRSAHWSCMLTLSMTCCWGVAYIFVRPDDAKKLSITFDGMGQQVVFVLALGFMIGLVFTYIWFKWVVKKPSFNSESSNPESGV